MSETISIIEILKGFTTLDGLKHENLTALARKTRINDLAVGQVLFNEGDREKRTFYLLAGQLELTDRNGSSTILEAGSNEARNPLVPVLPRRYKATARSAVKFISIDTDLLDVMLTWDQSGNYEVNELEETDNPGSGDWMTNLLQTKVFHRIPPSNIQAIFMRMQQVSFSAGDTIIKQGDEGNFFYVIIKGNCTVTRETPLSKDGIKLAELQTGDTFGEEALISESTRNATVTMHTDGSLMRLSKGDFKELLNEPMSDWVDYDEARKIVANGGHWLDVRLPSEFEAFHEEGAINIPLYFIRLKLKKLDPKKTYVLCCDTGRRSSAATFILNERGFNTWVLRGGLNNYRADIQ
ncbi:MAG: cyclic nucleotide-binding domain-containing protein [Gammaproteobacteria bacterium]|jgi:CRP-like cAMP-binding protein|nr:cyclic nucleotide-binding protein [Chromatiales bacterium]MCP4927374.1 cyclic nucleotide-binding domain-containing protein [Gammaproteobacteria bacterium]MDP7296884.1 cyclic nucleotide-binding domain-containing protein [Gammaproteobacteria bacterium]MDP7419029.1 cyclic nucleotide-binding domain-containing protein [Gammaproteobacteria bacterium]MDP7660119.1 cyclic nucleotide-binding domain-containing protein [Gammaproteobacteria bacterium]